MLVEGVDGGAAAVALRCEMDDGPSLQRGDDARELTTRPQPPGTVNLHA